MTVFNQVIKDFAAGDDLDVTRTVPSVPVSTPLTKAWLTLKNAETDLDAAAVVQKVITTTNAPGVGQITNDGASTGTGALLFRLSAVDTLLLTPYKTYVYDIQVKLSDARITTLETGIVVAGRGITQATS